MALVGAGSSTGAGAGNGSLASSPASPVGCRSPCLSTAAMHGDGSGVQIPETAELIMEVHAPEEFHRFLIGVQ